MRLTTVTVIISSFLATVVVRADPGSLDINRSQSLRVSRHKRSIVNLYRTLSCAVPKLRLAGGLSNYGCYCGLGGAGVPVDNIDQCCKEHDECYGLIYNHVKCKSMSEYFASYKTFSCKDKEAKCKLPSDYPVEDHYNKCRNMLCECDVSLGRCLQGEKYDKKFEYYNKKMCQFT